MNTLSSESKKSGAKRSIGDGTTLAFGFVLLFTFAVFGRPEDIVPIVGSLHLTYVLGACAGLAYVCGLFMGRARFQWTPELKLVLVLTAWFILGVPFAYWRAGSFHVLTDMWFKTAIGFFLLTQTLTSVDRVRKLIWAILLSELMATSISILWQGRLQWGGRLTGISEGLLGWNFLGITMSVTLPFMAFIYLSRRSLLQTGLLLGVLGSSIWMLVLNASRGGFLNVIFASILTWWFVIRGAKGGRIVGVLLVVCMMAVLAMAPKVLWVRLTTIWNPSSTTESWNPPSPTESGIAASADESTKDRQLLLEDSIKYTFQNPIFGLGLGNFMVYHGEQLHRPDAWFGTHNTYTQISSEAGIPAFLLLLLLMGTVVRHARKVSRHFAGDRDRADLHLLGRALLVSLASFAFGGFFAHIGYDYLLYYIVGISAGMWTIARAIAKTRKPLAESTGAVAANPSMQWFPEWVY